MRDAELRDLRKSSGFLSVGFGVSLVVLFGRVRVYVCVCECVSVRSPDVSNADYLTALIVAPAQTKLPYIRPISKHARH